jgi:hypothetical protein
MRLAAVVSAAAAVVNLLLLGLLHVVSPEVDPVTRPVSEYTLGEFGLAQRAYLVLSALWQLLAALAVLRNCRSQEVA